MAGLYHLSRHGFSVETLLAEGVPFFLPRYSGSPAGCGSIKLFGTEYGGYGEIKWMYVRPQFRRLGLGKLILSHLADYALAHGVKLIRLETGIHQQTAISLYERMGFARILPFGMYTEDPLSLFFEKQLE